MANTLTKQTLQDGERNLVVKCVIVGDGVEGDWSDQLLIDASTYTGAPSDLKIMKIWASLAGFSAMLEWDATTNVDIVSIPADDEVNRDFKEIGGLVNNAGTGKTGDILIDTTGLGAEEGSIVLWMRKS